MSMPPPGRLSLLSCLMCVRPDDDPPPDFRRFSTGGEATQRTTSSNPWVRHSAVCDISSLHKVARFNHIPHRSERGLPSNREVEIQEKSFFRLPFLVLQNVQDWQPTRRRQSLPACNCPQPRRWQIDSGALAQSSESELLDKSRHAAKRKNTPPA